MLINYVAPEIFEFISGCTTFQSAIEVLEGLFVKKRNKIFAKYQLISRKQSGSESVQDYVQKLKLLVKECEFTATTLEETASNYLLDALIAGIDSIPKHIKNIKNSSTRITCYKPSSCDQM